MNPPFFIIGNPRSGTTLLRLMLTNHPRLVVPPECGFAVWLHPDFGDWDGRVQRDPDLPAKYAREVVASRKFETWGLTESEVSSFLVDAGPQSYAEAVDAVYRLYARSIGKQIDAWGDKNNFYLAYIPRIREIFPSCRFVHIVRDGRDVACSYRALRSRPMQSKYAPELPVEISDIAEEWTTNLETIRCALNDVGTEAAHEIRYEDLIRNPEGTLRGVCEFLDQPFDAEMLAYHERNREREQEPREFLQWKEKTLEPPSDSGIGRFRKELTPAEAIEFERIAGEMLAAYGYSTRRPQ